MPCNRNTPTPPGIDFSAIATSLVAQLGSGLVAIDAPGLGRVEYSSAQNVAAALALLRQEAARAAGIQTAGVFTIGYCRGLGPSRGGCL